MKPATRLQRMPAIVTSIGITAGLSAGVAEAFDTGATGGGQAFSIQQPTLGVNFFVDPSTGAIGMSGFNFAPVGATPYDQTNRVLVGAGQASGLSNWTLGEQRGSNTHTLTVAQMPAHLHNYTTPGGAEQTSTVGGGAAFSNLQPTTAITYGISLFGIYPSQSLAAPENTLETNTANLGSTTPYIGSVMGFTGSTLPAGWLKAEGQLLPIAENGNLFSVVGTVFGGDGQTTFALPDLRGRAPIHTGGGPGLPVWQWGEWGGAENTTLSTNILPSHTHDMPDIGNTTDPTGGGQPFNTYQPGLGINYIISLQGVFPSQNLTASNSSDLTADLGLGLDPYIGEIAMFAGDFAPRGWALAQGQILSISQNTALFALLGTTYGGNGQTTFALPDLRGRTAVFDTLGLRTGAATNTLSVNNLPSHSHTYIPEPTSVAILASLGMLLTRRRRFNPVLARARASIV